MHYLFMSKFNSQSFFQELDISNVNFISQISFIYKTLNI